MLSFAASEELRRHHLQCAKTMEERLLGNFLPRRPQSMHQAQDEGVGALWSRERERGACALSRCAAAGSAEVAVFRLRCCSRNN